MDLEELLLAKIQVVKDYFKVIEDFIRVLIIMDRVIFNYLISEFIEDYNLIEEVIKDILIEVAIIEDILIKVVIIKLAIIEDILIKVVIIEDTLIKEAIIKHILTKVVIIKDSLIEEVIIEDFIKVLNLIHKLINNLIKELVIVVVFMVILIKNFVDRSLIKVFAVINSCHIMHFIKDILANELIMELKDILIIKDNSIKIINPTKANNLVEGMVTSIIKEDIIERNLMEQLQEDTLIEEEHSHIEEDIQYILTIQKVEENRLVIEHNQEPFLEEMVHFMSLEGIRTLSLSILHFFLFLYKVYTQLICHFSPFILEKIPQLIK